jgi:hypothetical protein
VIVQGTYQGKSSILKQDPRQHGTILKTRESQEEGEVVPLYEDGGTIILKDEQIT